MSGSPSLALGTLIHAAHTRLCNSVTGTASHKAVHGAGAWRRGGARQEVRQARADAPDPVVVGQQRGLPQARAAPHAHAVVPGAAVDARVVHGDRRDGAAVAEQARGALQVEQRARVRGLRAPHAQRAVLPDRARRARRRGWWAWPAGPAARRVLWQHVGLGPQSQAGSCLDEVQPGVRWR